ncbi:MAG: RsbRD N-terminal domain-containing protein [Desulfitobacteriaceae bacterium]|nr:RsbRD N-terminal domain-containing protein [Desulfitobacteriaceae bacterium]MDI6878707.1 RsbRD N-terminal domain-containing protein [Desulfitobacteriaceae bacterium]MDI6914110.1 RsbRD N-terminal domain-containing protein [Desulfitobacteriaceae bacterium]
MAQVGSPLKEMGSLLKEKEERILARWQSVLLGSYPESAARFFQNKDARFTNPVAYALEAGLHEVWNGLLEGKTPQELAQALDPLLRLRATQELSPSQAVGFILKLKGILQEEMSIGQSAPEAAALFSLEERIDALALLAFDVYVRCREQIFELRVRELRLTLGGLSPRERDVSSGERDVGPGVFNLTHRARE